LHDHTSSFAALRQLTAADAEKIGKSGVQPRRGVFWHKLALKNGDAPQKPLV
jgi:hypothetical protein